MSDEKAASAAVMDTDEDAPVLVDTLRTSMTALGSVQTRSLSAAQSALGTVSAEGDATVSASAVGKLDARDATLRQSAAGAVISDGATSMSQSFAPLIVATRVGLDHSGTMLVVADDVSATGSWIGFLATRHATLSDESRVIIDTRAALIIGAVLLGGFGLLAVAFFVAARRVVAGISELVKGGLLGDLPSLPQWVSRLRHRAA